LNTTRQEYTVQRVDGSARGVNILGHLPGTIYPDKWLVIGGHYDANQRATSGAYDNAAGAAMVIELARFFTEYYQSKSGPEISILFATWDAEEGGGAGSKHFVDNIPNNITIAAYINLDMCSLNYPIRNSIPGASEEYFKLNLYTSPVADFSGYSDVSFSESTHNNFTIFQTTMINVAYTINNYPPQWVLVMDDTETISDHRHFIRESIPAVWFRGMNEYPRNEGDMNERNFKHTPVDTIETMERYAGGKDELLKGIETGLIISYQLAFEVIKLSSSTDDVMDDGYYPGEHDKESIIGVTGWVIVAVAIIIIFIIYGYWRRYRKG
jgi:Zn-dependent M28 family amino/carboxypeptidase